jgi:ornithine carbamoyltransferase
MAVMTMATTIKKLETLSVRNLLADPDLTLDDLKLLFDLTERVKATPGEYAQALRGKQLAMIFEKPSLRTRTTFEVGITSLGGLPGTHQAPPG